MMYIVHLDSVSRHKVEMQGASGVYKQLPVGSAQGAPHFSFRVFSMQPGGHTPYHEHDSEHVNYVIEGQGALVDGQGMERSLSAGDFALVLPREKHQYKNTSADTPFVMICAVPKEYE
jgi:quercetin dioxygenase-like cupin family protein